MEFSQNFYEEFKTLQRLMFSVAKERGWHNPSKSFAENILMAHTELSEAVEAYRRPEGSTNEIWLENEKPEGVPIELADLVIRVLDMCELYEIDLLQAILMKTSYNLTRSHRHGGKTL